MPTESIQVTTGLGCPGRGQPESRGAARRARDARRIQPAVAGAVLVDRRERPPL